MPSTDTAVVAYIEGIDAELRPTARALRTAVRKGAPRLQERICMGVPQWFDARPVLYLADYSHHLNLGFCRGAFLADPRGLLEGSGKGLRHVKVRTVEQARSPDLAALIRRAAAAGSGVVG